MPFSTRDLLLKYANSSENKGLSPEQKKQSTRALVDNCDDNFSFYTEIKNDVLTEVKYEGSGCVISCAASSLITSIIKTKKINEISDIIKMYENYLFGEIDNPTIKEFEIFEIVREHKSRIKCALAPIKAIKERLEI